MPDADPLAHRKREAALAALDAEVRSGMTVGLGSGSTAAHFIALLGERLAAGNLRDVRAVATSHPSELLAARARIPMLEPDAGVACDVVVDGADEVDANLDLIKGLGGALVREKIVAQASRRRVIIVDETKRVARLGEKGPLPIEVVRWGHPWQAEFLKNELGGDPRLRRGDDEGPFVTDNGHHIYDVAFGPIKDAAALEARLLDRGGVVQTGLFLGMADVVLVAGASGVETLVRDP